MPPWPGPAEMIADTFISRPRLAGVISIVLFLAGLIAMTRMPVEQFPNIVPPQVSVTASYPGAGAEVTEATVAQVIEDKVIGVDSMIYMKSTSGADGSYALNISFEVGTDPDIATVLVQNRVALAEPLLPAEVKQTGVKVAKKSSSLLLGVVLHATDAAITGPTLTNYARINLVDALKRVPGVGDATVFAGDEFAMRVNLDVDRLTALNLTPADVTAALRSQNLQAAIGRVGGQRPRPATERPDPGPPFGTRGVRAHHHPCQPRWQQHHGCRCRHRRAWVAQRRYQQLFQRRTRHACGHLSGAGCQFAGRCRRGESNPRPSGPDLSGRDRL